MEKCLVDQSQLQSRINVLEAENNSLQDTLTDQQAKYAEALITLKEVQDAVSFASFLTISIPTTLHPTSQAKTAYFTYYYSICNKI